jgi:hypothetical protein
MQAPFAEFQRVDLAVEVAIERKRQARIGGEDIHHVLPEFAPVIELHGRDQHAFLEAFRRGRVIVPGDVAAHVVPMADRREVAEDAAVAEDGFHETEIGQMRTAVIGVVEDPDIALMHPR